jgi:hypothetical protein
MDTEAAVFDRFIFFRQAADRTPVDLENAVLGIFHNDPSFVSL